MNDEFSSSHHFPSSSDKRKFLEYPELNSDITYEFSSSLGIIERAIGEDRIYVEESLSRPFSVHIFRRLISPRHQSRILIDLPHLIKTVLLLSAMIVC
jgi:hypothetical protein